MISKKTLVDSLLEQTGLDETELELFLTSLDYVSS